jgi:hypothetical protein
MRRFASREWVAELDACLARAPVAADAPPLVVRYVVSDVPDATPSTACYRIELDGGRLRAVYGRATEADERPTVTFSQPYAVAAAIARGELAAQTAILDGRLRVHGTVAALPAWRRCLGGVDAAMEELRRTTIY